MARTVITQTRTVAGGAGYRQIAWPQRNDHAFMPMAPVTWGHGYQQHSIGNGRNS
jgi:hypothetical protein